MKNYTKFRKRMWPRRRQAFGVRGMIPFAMIGFGALTGLVIMSLWNWIMPVVFGLGAITFFQAIGMFILGRLLFGGFKKRSHWGMMKHRYAYCHVNQHGYKNAEGESVTQTGESL